MKFTNFFPLALPIAIVQAFSYQNEAIGRRSPLELAPEINKGHPHRHRKFAESLKYSICFYDDALQEELNSFEMQYNEFFVKKSSVFKIVYLEIPDSLAEDVLLDIRTEPFVEAVEHVLYYKENNIYWNKERIAVKNLSEVSNDRKLFVGLGNDVDIYVVDSGIDDHAEFGNSIDRKRSKQFNNRADSYD
eukprot:Awhi_evm1s13617